MEAAVPKVWTSLRKEALVRQREAQRALLLHAPPAERRRGVTALTGRAVATEGEEYDEADRRPADPAVQSRRAGRWRGDDPYEDDQNRSDEGRREPRQAQADAGALPIWREDTTGRGYSLIITRAGREAIGLDDQPSATPRAPERETKPNSGESNDETAAKRSRSSESDASPESIRATPRAGSKQALVIDMLSKKGGATIDQLIAATGWLPHTTRAALTGLRKRGFAITRAPRENGGSTYRIASGPTTTQA